MEHAYPYRPCVTDDIFKINEVPDGLNAEEITKLRAESDEYLKHFVAPVFNDEGKQVCFHCGGVLDGLGAMLGIGVGYIWGLVHGEAYCSGCKYPARGMHHPKGSDGTPLWDMSNVFLAYHPDYVEEKG